MPTEQRTFRPLRPLHDWLDADYYHRLPDLIKTKAQTSWRMLQPLPPDMTQHEIDDAAMKLWRWEFLRRHPIYNENWKSDARDIEVSRDLFGLTVPAFSHGGRSELFRLRRWKNQLEGRSSLAGLFQHASAFRTAIRVG